MKASIKQTLDELESRLNLSTALKQAIIEAVKGIQARGGDPVLEFQALKLSARGDLDYTTLTDGELRAIIRKAAVNDIGDLTSDEFEDYLSHLRKSYVQYQMTKNSGYSES